LGGRPTFSHLVVPPQTAQPFDRISNAPRSLRRHVGVLIITIMPPVIGLLAICTMKHNLNLPQPIHVVETTVNTDGGPPLVDSARQSARVDGQPHSDASVPDPVRLHAPGNSAEGAEGAGTSSAAGPR
jgi:hypothetical protein